MPCSSPLPCYGPKSNLHHPQKISVRKHNGRANSKIRYWKGKRDQIVSYKLPERGKVRKKLYLEIPTKEHEDLQNQNVAGAKNL